MMIRFLRALRIALFGVPRKKCNHQWDTIKEVRVFDDDDSKLARGTKYVLRCQHCGDMRAKTL